MTRTTPSKALIAPEHSNNAKEEAIGSTDIPPSKPSAVATEEGNEVAVNPTDDEPSDEEVPQNQLGVPEHYFAFYGHCK